MGTTGGEPDSESEVDGMGLAILVDMYHKLHEIVYRKGWTWACGIVFEYIWAWEHIIIVQP